MTTLTDGPSGSPSGTPVPAPSGAPAVTPTAATPSAAAPAVADPRAEIAHLLRRAGFGARGDEIDAALHAGYEATVAALVAGPGAAGDPGAAATPLPVIGPDPDYAGPGGAPGKDTSPAAKKANNAARQEQAQKAIAWWLDRMTRVTSPFVEKRTFFWHGHFATSQAKVRDVPFMLLQNQTLRTLGGGDFGTLVHAIVRDPAMMIWLDAAGSTRKAPNENLGRELMELFTLGVGNYTETDVREAARALTGWRLDRRTGVTSLDQSVHDPGPETVLGQTASFDDTSLVDLLVSTDFSHTFVVTRIWNRFAAPGDVPADVLTRLLAAYGPARDLGALFRALFLDPVFRGPQCRKALVKQPVEYVVGVLRALGLTVDVGPGKTRQQLVSTLNGLGQTPFEPPNVGGWPAGSAWLTTAAAQVRLTFAEEAVRLADVKPISSVAVGSRPDTVARLLGVDAWSARTAAALTQVASEPQELLVLALNSPEYLVN